MNYFVTAIHTDSGKTFVSAILCEALAADYWKPVQAGLPRDTETVASLVTNKFSTFHPEAYLLKTPASPHAAAKIDNVEIHLKNIRLPQTNNRNLIIEGAGGCLVPLNQQNMVIDIAVNLNIPVILVSNIYLGSINHTLLTYEALAKRNIPIRGLIFNGKRNPETENIIVHHTRLEVLLKIDHEPMINRETVMRYAGELRKRL
jgi:dethiobiotin synthetase